MTYRKKIALVSRKFDKNSGSAEWIYAERLYEELKKNMNVYRVCQTTKYKTINDFFLTPIKIIKLRTNGFKTIHFLNENQAIYNSFARLIGFKTITTFHDFMGLNSKGIHRIYFKIVYKMASKSDHIVCNSTKTKEEFKRIIGQKNKNVHLIYPFHLPQEKFKRKEKTKIIGFIGSLQKRKRPDFLIKIAEKNPSYKIEIWGKGELKNNLRRNILKKGLKNIFLMGYAPYDKMNNIYNKFDVFIFPTKEEGLGLPIIESLMNQTPVIILKDSKIPKELKKLCFVSKDENDITKYIKKLDKNRFFMNKELLKKYTLKRNINKLISIYLR